jgi:zinc protease
VGLAHAQGPQPIERLQVTADPAAAALAGLEADMPVDPRIRVGELDNGLRFWIRENSYPANRAELWLVVRAGSMQEDPDQLGLAHFVEHMAFNGTRTYPKQELVRILESFGMRFGAHVNASTGFDATNYFLVIPTDRDDIVDTAFQILEDWAHGVAFDEAEIDKERGVVIEEWRLGLGAGSRIRDQQLPVLFEGSRYADRLPIGKLDVLENFDYEAARRYYRDWYRPDLMGVIAVGDFEADAIEAKIREHFGSIAPAAEDVRPRDYETLQDADGTRFAIVTDPETTLSTVEFYQFQPLRRQAYHGAYRRSIVEALFMRMFNRRLAEQAQAPDPPFLGAGASQDIFVPTAEAFVMGAGVQDGRVAQGLRAVFAELERVARFGFTDTELAREKSQLMRLFENIYTEQNVQDSRLFAEEFTRAFLEGESTPGIDYEWALYQRFMPGIELEEVNRVGQEWLLDDDRVVLVTAPDKPGLKLPSEDQLLAAMDLGDTTWLRPYIDTTVDRPLISVEPLPGSVVEERTIEEIGVTEWTLSNGARVVIKPTDFRQEQVLFRAISPGGYSLVPDEDWVAASSAVQVVSSSGFGGFSQREITNLLADKVASVRPIIGPLEEGLIGTAAPRDLEAMFQLAYLTITEPRADETVFDLIRERMSISLANRDVSPEAAFQETVQRTMSQDHPRRRPLSIELLDEMDLEKSYLFYVDRFADVSDFTFVIVGNVQPEDVRPLAEKYLASLPGQGREETWADEGVRPPRGVITKTVNRGLEPKSLTTIVFSGEGPEADVDTENESLSAMAEVLQTRLREVLREDLGGTYGVNVSAAYLARPTNQYSVSIVFGSDPGRVDELTGEVFREIERLKGAPPAPAEVDSVIESFRRDYELSLQENGFWLSELVNAYDRGKDPRDILGFEESLEKITPEGVRQTAARYFDLDNYVQISLLPEEADE